MQQTINPELRWRQWRASIAFSRHFNWIWTFISRLSQTVNANWEMKTVSLFVWGSCFKTWIIHNHLGNLRWNVPPLYDQVSKVSRSRSRKGHRSHKLCCQPPPDSGVSDAGPSLWAALSRCIPHKIIFCLSLLSRDSHSWYWGKHRAGDAGPSADHRVTQRRETTTKPVRQWSTSDQSEARGEARWPMRGRDEASEGPVCQWPGVTTGDWDKSRSGSGSVSSGPPTAADTDRDTMSSGYLTRDTDTHWLAQSRSIQDLWIGSFPWWCTVTNKNLTNNK